MQLVRIFVPFLNELVDIAYFQEFDSLNLWDIILVKHKESDSFSEIIDAKIISLIDTWDTKSQASDKVFFSKICSKDDLIKIKDLRKKTNDYVKIFEEESKRLLIDLIPVWSEISFTEKTILFIYTAKERVDFRELLKNLANKIKKRIQLRHIWARDRSSVIWWFWVCWREICCHKFLRNISSVKIDAVKDQEFFHRNSDNVSWLCWKLKCCLNYEVEQYKEMKKWMPKVWKRIFINNKEWRIIWLDIFNQKVKIRFEQWSEIVNVSDLPKDL